MLDFKSTRHSTYSLPFAERAVQRDTPLLTAFLLYLMTSKRTNLCLSADVQSSDELLDLAEECGDSICILKTHSDIIYDFDSSTMERLTEVSMRKKFIIFEDRKFGDIGHTVQKQYTAGPHRIASWATLVNAHIFPGPAIISALRSAAYEAVSSSNMIITREITGGKFPARPKLSSQRDEDSDDVDDDATSTGTGASDLRSRYDDVSKDDDEDDASSVDFSPRRHETVYNRQLTRDELRKGSIVSISTTISSTTEYIPPEVHSPTPNSLPNDLQIPTICRGLLLLAQMSSEDNLFTAEYTKRCIELARQNRDFVLGFIAQEGLNEQKEDNFLTMTPGVSLPPSSSEELNQVSSVSARRPSQHWPPPRRVSIPLEKVQGDGKGQQYNTPRRVILEKGADVIIVGRGIIEADDPSTEAERYRREGWQALCERWRR